MLQIANKHMLHQLKFQLHELFDEPTTIDSSSINSYKNLRCFESPEGFSYLFNPNYFV